MNTAFADILREERKKFVISVKARDKYQKNGRLNSSYNLGKNAYDKAKKVAKNITLNIIGWRFSLIIIHILCFWIVKGFRREKGNFNKKCRDKEIGEMLVNEKRHFFDFEDISNIKK